MKRSIITLFLLCPISCYTMNSSPKTWLSLFFGQTQSQKIFNTITENDSARVKEIILKEPGDVNQINDQGQTPLHCAASQGNTEIIKTLIAAGASGTMLDHNGKNPLEIACSEGHAVSALLLYKAGARKKLLNEMLLFAALESEDEEALSQLIAEGVDPNAIKDEQTALKVATIHENRRIIAMLLDAGANPRKSVPEQESPFDYTTGKNDFTIARQLIEAGALDNDAWQRFSYNGIRLLYGPVMSPNIIDFLAARNFNRLLLKWSGELTDNNLIEALMVAYGRQLIEPATYLAIELERRGIELHTYLCKAITYAVARRDIQTVYNLLHDPKITNHPHYKKFLGRLLKIAVMNNQRPIIELLLASYAPVDQALAFITDPRPNVEIQERVERYYWALAEQMAVPERANASSYLALVPANVYFFPYIVGMHNAKPT